MTDRHSYMRRPSESGDLEAVLDAYYRMPRSTLVATFPTRKPRLPLKDDRCDALNIPCVASASNDRDGGDSSFQRRSIAQPSPGHLSSFSSNRIGGIKWEPRTNPEIWPG